MVSTDKLGLKNLFSRFTRFNRLADYRKTLADYSEEGVAVIDIEGTIKFVNDVWPSMHGYTEKDELVGKNIKQFCHKKTVNDFDRLVAMTKLHGWYIDIFEQSRKDGTSFPARLKMAAIKNDSAESPSFLLVVMDLSQIRQMQKMVRQTTDELETLKARIKLLEEKLADHGQADSVVCENGGKSDIRGLPVDELKQLADMAKRFR